MTMNEYQIEAKKTADFPTVMVGNEEVSWIYPAMGLAGEAGEVVEKLKKILRNKEGKITLEDVVAVTKEIGDVLWYLAILADELGVELENAAMGNVMKLRSRQERGVIKSVGDDR